MRAKYDTHRFCSQCGQDDGWYLRRAGIRCPIHGHLMRNSARLTANKKEERWEKAY